MIYLLPNTANQTLRLSLNESRAWLDTFTHYLVEFKSVLTAVTFYLVADVDSENDRITEIIVSTDDDDAVNSSIELLQSGQYTYRIFGQNSATNLDPENAAVVGVAEYGTLMVRSTTTYYESAGITVPSDEIATIT